MFHKVKYGFGLPVYKYVNESTIIFMDLKTVVLKLIVYSHFEEIICKSSVVDNNSNLKYLLCVFLKNMYILSLASFKQTRSFIEYIL